jgi:hypothetical protein
VKTTDELSAHDGELIGRLIDVVNIDGRWYDLAWYLVFAVGGRRLDEIEPDTGTEPAPGTVSEVLRRTHEVVSRAAYFEAIRDRLTQLVQSGLREDVLVRALRDELTMRLREFTEVDDANRRREDLRRDLERRVSDPSELARFRETIASSDPGRAALSDDELVAEIRRLADRLAPIPIEGELRAWADHDQWVESIDAVLSDEAIDKWLKQYVRPAHRSR